MKFGVIYTADIPIADNPFEGGGAKLADFHPRLLKHKRGTWQQTENSSDSERDSYGVDWRHAKWCAVLDKKQLKEFLYHFEFEYRTCCDTMGALGMPGVEPWYGCAPAWSFDAPNDGAMVNIYLTPWPEVKKKSGVADNEENWKRLKRALECVFP